MRGGEWEGEGKGGLRMLVSVTPELQSCVVLGWANI